MLVKNERVGTRTHATYAAHNSFTPYSFTPWIARYTGATNERSPFRCAVCNIARNVVGGNVNTNEQEQSNVAFQWNDIDYDIDWVRDVLHVAVPECINCTHVAMCDCVISDCLDYGVIELRVVVTGK